MLNRTHRTRAAFAALFLTAVTVLAARQSVCAPPVSLWRGVARDPASGKPLANVAIFLLDLPPVDPRQYPGLRGEPVVITNARGEFVWTGPPENYGPNTNVPAAFVLAVDRSRWRVTPETVSASPFHEGQKRRELWQGLTREAKTRWDGDRLVMEAVAPAEITLVVRGPNDQPLTNTPVRVYPAPRAFAFSDSQTVRFDGRTDANGRLALRWPPGPVGLIVFAPGIGYGATGTFDALPGQSVALDLPPLAPLTTITGRVAPGLIRPGGGPVVRFARPQENNGEPLWNARTTTVDANGGFVLADVTPGRHTLLLFDSAEQAAKWTGGGARARHLVPVAPGVPVTNVVLRPLIAAPPLPAVRIVPAAAPVPPPPVKGTVRGVVTSAAGQPVAGATVWAICTYDGGTRLYRQTISALAGPDGRYTISDLPQQPAPGSGIGVTLVAVGPGGPPAFAGITLQTAESDAPTLVLPDQSGALVARVLSPRGAAQAGVLVEAAPDATAALLGGGVRDVTRGDAFAALARVLRPRAITNARGEARFENLSPDRYTLRAVLPDPADKQGDPLAPLSYGYDQKNAFDVSAGVPVSPGETTTHTLRLKRPAGQLKVRLLFPDGTPGVRENIGLSFARVPRARSGGGMSTGADARGVGDFSSLGAGLVRLSAAISKGDPGDNNGPALQGEVVVAHSPFAPRPPGDVVEIRLRRVRPGRLAVTLRDAANRPVPGGTVILGDYDHPFPGLDPGRAASTNAQGRVVFDGLATGAYRVHAHLPGQPPLPELAGERGDPDALALPPDDALRNRLRYAAQEAVVAAEQETRLVLRPTRIGYVRGVVRSRDASRTPYHLDVPYPLRTTLGSAIQQDPATGAFVAGPFSPGRTTFVVTGPVKDANGETDYLPLATGDVMVPPGGVARLDLTTNGPSPLAAHPWSQIREQRRRAAAVTGTVLLPGGAPAAGALVRVFVPGQPYPQLLARADATGRFARSPLGAADYFWSSDDADKPVPRGDPKQAVAVAYLPGTHGAVIVPLPEAGSAPLRLVLPAARALAGRVLVGGRAPNMLHFPGTIRVRAAYHGQGRLNDILSVETTAQDDGTFTLRGLTSGTYTVQAVLDDVYVSPSAALTVPQAGEKPLASVALDVPAPGGPVLVTLVDRSGAPVPAGTRVFRARPPDGPLAETLLPPNFVADTAGQVRLEGLPAGRQTLIVNAPAGPTFTVVVPERGQPAARVRAALR